MSKTAKKPNAFAATMFETIRESLKNSEKKGNQSFRDILKFEVGKTYLVRILPNLKQPELTFYHYYNHGWQSFSTGQYMTAVCPTTYGETCPIDQERFRIWKAGSDQEKEMAKAIKRKENWMCNVYVISDPTNPENEGKVKILRYGTQLNKIIDAAINGDDAEEFGAKIFDLSENGCTLRIKAESVAENKRSWTTYTSSKFLGPKAIDEMTEEKMEEIQNSLFDLEKIEGHKSQSELQEMLDVHYHGKVGSKNDSDSAARPTGKAGAALESSKEDSEDSDEEDEIDLSPRKEEDEKESTGDDEASNDQRVEDLLKDL